MRVSRDILFDEYASWYAPETAPNSTPFDADYAEQEVEADAQPVHVTDGSPITTELSGPQESSCDPSTSRTSPKPDKGKMLDDGNDSDGSTPSLDSEFGVPIMRTPGVKKALSSASEKLRRSSREKNPVTRLGYNKYMAHHYAFAMKLAAERVLKSPPDAIGKFRMASLHPRLEGEKPEPTGNHTETGQRSNRYRIRSQTETGRPDTGHPMPKPAIRSRSRFNRIEDPDNPESGYGCPQLELEGEC